ncbi:MAG: IPT/TIG domain-containing protein [Planctomycetota bacterium]
MRKTFAWLGFGSIAVVMAATALLTSGCGTGSTVNRPIVTSIVPPAGVPAGGTPIKINGANFAEFYTTVTIGGVPVDNLVWISSTQLTCTTPPSMTTGPRDIVVTTYEGSTTLAGGFSYFPPPTLTAVNPTFVVSLSGGQSVTLSGTGFQNASVASTSVTFGGVAATNLAVQTDTALTCDLPAHAAGLVDVQLSNPNGIATLVNAFTYVAPQLFAVVRAANSELFTLDPGTGASTSIGLIGAPIDSIAIDPTTLQMYGTTITYGPSQASDLYAIDSTTGLGLLVGPVGVGVWDLTYFGGALYGITPNGVAYEINTTTGAGTMTASGLGSVFWATSTWPTLRAGFAAHDTSCYFAVGSGASSLRRVDPAAGTSTDLGVLTGAGVHSVRAMGTLDGVLFGLGTVSGQNSGSGNSAQTRLYSIDPTTRAVISITNTLGANFSGICGNTP